MQDHWDKTAGQNLLFSAWLHSKTVLISLLREFCWISLNLLSRFVYEALAGSWECAQACRHINKGGHLSLYDRWGSHVWSYRYLQETPSKNDHAQPKQRESSQRAGTCRSLDKMEVVASDQSICYLYGFIFQSCENQLKRIQICCNKETSKSEKIVRWTENWSCPKPPLCANDDIRPPTTDLNRSNHI